MEKSAKPNLNSQQQMVKQGAHKGGGDLLLLLMMLWQMMLWLVLLILCRSQVRLLAATVGSRGDGSLHRRDATSFNNQLIATPNCAAAVVVVLLHILPTSFAQPLCHKTTTVVAVAAREVEWCNNTTTSC